MVCSVADRCGPRFSAAWRSPSVQLPDTGTTVAPRCLYCRNKRRAGCSTSVKEAKSPRPRRRLTNSAHPSLSTSFALRATYLPMSSGSEACVGRGMQVGRLAVGSEFLRGSGLFWGGRSEGGERARVLVDGARFGGWHREQTFCSPSGILGHRRRGRRDLGHRLDRPLPEGEFLFTGGSGVIPHVPATRVAHTFYLVGGARLALRVQGRRG